MNYYIQGDAANADKIKAAFEAKGISDGGNSFIHKNYLYFSEGGEVEFCGIGGHIANVIKTHPDYKELKLPIEFKDGDIIGFNDCTHNGGRYIDWVGIYRHQINDSINHEHFFHCVVTDKNAFRTGGSWRVFTAYPATKEQRDLLFRKMKEAGYQWDADKKELKKIQPHYDIRNFQPFDKVLVRCGNDEEWMIEFYCKYDTLVHTSPHRDYPFMGIGDSYSQCIPFEGNEHLLGTTDMCDDRFINW